MRTLFSNRIGLLARAYWQPLALAVLALLACSQVIAWGVAAIELGKVDSLIEQTKNAEPAALPAKDGAKTATPGAPPQGMQPGGPAPGGPAPGGPAPGGPAPGGPAPGPIPGAKPGGAPPQEKKPAKNIFKKTQVNYKLSAIYLDKAVINGQPVTVGQNVGKAKLKEINIFSAVLEDEKGKPITLQLFQGGGGGGGGAPAPMTMQQPPTRKNGKNKSSKVKKPPNMSAPQGMKRMGGMGGGGMNAPAGFNFRGMSMDQLKNLSNEEKMNLSKSLSASEKETLQNQFKGQR
jgi:hypothetical protein